MISSDDVDLMSWNSPTNPPGIRALPKPLIPTVNIQSPSMINNPFDDVCEKIIGEIQNPFDEICSLVEKQVAQEAKPSQKQDNEVNLLNMTILTISKEEDNVPNLSAISIPEANSSQSSDILNVSSLDDNLLDDKVVDDVKEWRVRENNNCLSQSQCDYSYANTSMNDSYYEHGQRYHELCSKLDSSFNKSKAQYEQIISHDQQVLAKFKRRSAEFTKQREREEEEKKAVEKALSTSQTICSKSTLKPIQSPNLKLRSCSSMKTLTVKKETKGLTRQGPMKALAPLKSMVKSSNSVPEKDSTDATGKTLTTGMFKSSYHKSPVKTLNLRSKSAPRLTSSTPEKASSLPRPSFSSPSPLKSVATSPIKALEEKSRPFISPLKSVGTSPIKSLESPLRSTRNSNSQILKPSFSFKFPLSPLKSENSLGNSPATNPLAKSNSSCQLKFRASPLKECSANVGGGLAATRGMVKPRSSSLSRLKPPRSVGSKINRINVSHEEKENFAVQYVV